MEQSIVLESTANSSQSNGSNPGVSQTQFPIPHSIDPIDLQLQLLYTTISFTLACVTLFFAVTGCVTNAVSVIVFTRPAMRSSINILLAGLSSFDLVFSLLSIPTFVAPPLCIYKPNEWRVYCAVTTFSTLYIYPFTNVAKTGGVWTLVYITVQRWVTVRRPFRRARGSSLALASRSLYAILVAAVLYNSPRFFEHQPSDQPDVLVEEALRRDPFYMSFYYSILYLLTHFVVPFALLAFINGTMTCAIRRALKQQRMLSHSEKAAAMMATIVLVFLCCNTLPFVMNFVEFINRDLWFHPETKISLWTLNDVSNILLLVNASLNAFIYYFCNQKYAQLLKRNVLETCRYAKERFNYPSDRYRYSSNRFDLPSNRPRSATPIKYRVQREHHEHSARICSSSQSPQLNAPMIIADRWIEVSPVDGITRGNSECRLISSQRVAYQKVIV